MTFFMMPSTPICLCLLCCCVISHTSFLLVIGDAEGDTPFDSLYRFLFVKIPSKCRRGFRWIFGSKFDRYWDGFVHYLFYTNNCCAQIFYLFLTVGGYTGFMITGERIRNCHHVAMYNSVVHRHKSHFIQDTLFFPLPIFQITLRMSIVSTSSIHSFLLFIFIIQLDIASRHAPLFNLIRICLCI